MSTYEISKSSLLSLKAEILKKQEEVNKAKLENKNKFPKDVKRGPLELKNKGVDNRASNDVVELEDTDLLTKSRQTLEAKTKLYDRLSKQGSRNEEEREHNRRYLVHFDKKARRSKVSDLPPDDGENDYDRYPESEDELGNDDDYKAQNSDDEWVEYVDYLGRTRTCLKKDLHLYKKKDANLRQRSHSRSDDEVEMNKRNESDKDKEPVLEEDFDENSEMLSADMRRELQRREWEKEEATLRDKKNIHYQDILFGEARTHGVGYYGFAKDEQERATQQEALNKLRQETQEQQKRAQDIKKSREKQLKARVRAAENRKRARMGLPPLTSDDEEEKKEEEPVVEKTPQPTEEDKEREAMRKAHIRPWDLGKKGVKEHYEYSQEEWVALQRSKRDNEFAPPSSYKHKEVELDDSATRGLYFSSKKTDKKATGTFVDVSKPPPYIKNPNKRKTSESIFEEPSRKFTPQPMVNECSDDSESDSDRLLNDYKKSNRKGAEIAPPATYDYYGPSGSSKRTKQPSNSKVNIEESIMEGLKFLREKVEKKQL